MGSIAKVHLTPRELEVARLIAEGFTDRLIAERLSIGRRTAEWHVLQIFNKLGVSSRAQVAAWTARERVFDADEPAKAPPQHNLPTQITTFIGRVDLVSELSGLLSTRRLITLAGTAGAGKTRLAIEVARANLERYSDGVWFVDLGPIRDGWLVAPAFAAALKVSERPRQPVAETLISHIRDRQLLIVADNCEHVIEDCASLIDQILRSCERVAVIVTSRESLRLSGETTRQVPPLSVPAVGQPDDIAHSESVQLFVDRAERIAPGFQLTDETTADVGRICSKLDGLPLAIELAAARINLLSTKQILSRLEDRFGLLTTGGRNAPERHQSLQAALAWSDELLGETERTLFRRLSVFGETFTLEAAEEVCSLEPLQRTDIADLLGSLVQKSLVLHLAPEATRFRLLDTVREYASRHLKMSPDMQLARRRHCEYFVALTGQAYYGIRSAEQKDWRIRVTADFSNIRDAFDWATDHDHEAALGLAWALNDFWVIQGMFWEGESWFERALGLYRKADDLRAKGLAEGGWMAWHRSDMDRAAARWNEALDLYRALGDVRGIGHSLQLIGDLAFWRGDLTAARAICEQGLQQSRKAGDAFWIAGALRVLGQLDLAQGDPHSARAHLEESLSWSAQIGDPRWRSYTLLPLALCAIDLGDFEIAHSYLMEYALIASHLGFVYGLVAVLAGFASLASAGGNSARAMRLIGAADALSESIGIDALRFNKAPVERWLEKSREELHHDEAGTYRSEGRTWTTEQALAYALNG